MGRITGCEENEKCVWTRLQVVVQVSFLEWVGKDYLPHAKFAGVRDEKEARDVTGIKFLYPVSATARDFDSFSLSPLGLQCCLPPSVPHKILEPT
jgi:ATP-dependent DNA ligase